MSWCGSFGLKRNASPGPMGVEPSSPKGKFAGAGKEISEALGRKPRSTDLMERHPFDVEIIRIEPGKAGYPFHLHSAQWEFYHVISGAGAVRHQESSITTRDDDRLACDP